MNLLIVLSENRRVLPWARTKAELVTNRGFNVTFVNCMSALSVCNNIVFPRTWRSPRDCHRDKVSSPSRGNAQSCYGRYWTLSVWAAWIYINSPMQSLCCISPEKFCFSVFLALLSNVLNQLVFSFMSWEERGSPEEWEAKHAESLQLRRPEGKFKGGSLALRSWNDHTDWCAAATDWVLIAVESQMIFSLIGKKVFRRCVGTRNFILVVAVSKSQHLKCTEKGRNYCLLSLDKVSNHLRVLLAVGGIFSSSFCGFGRSSRASSGCWHSADLFCSLLCLPTSFRQLQLLDKCGCLIFSLKLFSIAHSNYSVILESM